MKNTLMIALMGSAALFMNGCNNASAVLPQTPVMLNPAAAQFQSQPLMRQNSMQQQSKEILVRFRPDAPRHLLAIFADKYQLQLSGYLQEINVYVYTHQSGMTQQGLQQMLSQMNQDAAVAYAELNQKIEVTPIFN